MSLLTSALRYDNAFFFNIFYLKKRKVISKVLPGISHSANGYYYPLIPVLLYLLSPGKAFHFFITALISFSLELPLCTIMKHSIRRNRPFEILEGVHFRSPPGDRFSLPSGHTAASFVIAVLISFLYPIMIVPSLIWASLVGISRIYLGVHYPTDVLAGMVLGIISSLSGIVLAGNYFWEVI